MSRLALTGATGFVGGHVLARLLDEGHEVSVLARPGPRPQPWPGQVHVVTGDLSDPQPDLYRRLGCPDSLIHLAWEGLPHYRASRHFQEELPRQYRFLEALVRQGLRHLVVSGTCFEYGLQCGSLAEDLPTEPATAYGHAKDALRRQLAFLQREQPFGLSWARLFYLHGPGQARGSLYSQLEAALAAGQASFPMSSGEQLRDFLPVAEVARRLVLLARLGRDTGPVNLCSGAPVSVRALVEGWLRERGASITLDRGRYPLPDHEPLAFWGDGSRFAALEAAAPAPTPGGTA